MIFLFVFLCTIIIYTHCMYIHILCIIMYYVYNQYQYTRKKTRISFFFFLGLFLSWHKKIRRRRNEKCDESRKVGCRKWRRTKQKIWQNDVDENIYIYIIYFVVVIIIYIVITKKITGVFSYEEQGGQSVRNSGHSDYI